MPAAGVGARVGAGYPKQYLLLHGKTILEHTLERLLEFKQLAKIVLPVAADDCQWSNLALLRDKRIAVVTGGRERCHSVFNGLEALANEAKPEDWVLVHDAARPCITPEQVQHLVDSVGDHQIGGILGLPVSDTLKHVKANTIISTIDRSTVWCAQTPQMFRYGKLYDALNNALRQNSANVEQPITDEAAALESMGYQPMMVKGHRDNIKVTVKEDIPLAAFVLSQQAPH